MNESIQTGLLVLHKCDHIPDDPGARGDFFRAEYANNFLNKMEV